MKFSLYSSRLIIDYFLTVFIQNLVGFLGVSINPALGSGMCDLQAIGWTIESEDLVNLNLLLCFSQQRLLRRGVGC